MSPPPSSSSSSPSSSPSPSPSPSSNNQSPTKVKKDTLLPPLRQRASSVQMVIQHVTHPPSDHPLATSNFDQTALLSPVLSSPSSDHHHSQSKKSHHVIEYWEEASQGFWHDLKTMRWMRHPGTSFRMILIFLIPYLLLDLARSWSWISSNPISPFVSISYPLPIQTGESYQTYGKGPKDLLFLGFYIIVFSFVRQTVTELIVRPYAIWLKLRGTKQHRFVDQGYAVFYWGSSTIIGLIVMSKQPTWWYKTSEFWAGYPHYRMEPSLKTYYLLQFSYWLQQMLVLSLRLEKPRSDFLELVIHHFVTLWLVGWSYIVNLTMIGTAIFVSMDISDTFLGISKCINYTKYQHTSEISFAIFLCVWTYFRHWQNLRILYSVYYEYDKYLPEFAKRWSPSNEVYLAGWMKWQVFGPIMLLQILNLFWYYLIWRIVFRMLTAGNIADVREEGETDEEDNDDGSNKEKAQ